jgi:hypothetical protein
MIRCIAAEDIGKCAYGIFKKGHELIGKTVGIGRGRAKWRGPRWRESRPRQSRSSVPSRSALMEQDAHAREAIGVRDQPDDLEQHIPLKTCRKLLGELLEAAGLITDRLPGEPQDP